MLVQNWGKNFYKKTLHPIVFLIYFTFYPFVVLQNALYLNICYSNAYKFIICLECHIKPFTIYNNYNLNTNVITH